MNDNIKAGADIHAGDGGYSEGNKKDYEAFVKIRNQSLGKMRIKELIAEADRKCSETRGIYDEILAELIVKECAEFVSNDRQNDEYGVFVANRIKEHFGVE